MNAKDWDRHAQEYHQEILSPHHPKVSNPLIEALHNIKAKKKKSVAEFGCGLCVLGEYLHKHFKSVHVSDFSPAMVKHAKKNNPQLHVVKEDLTKLKHKNKFDVIISINSVIMPSLKDIKKSFANMYQAMKKGGDLLLIVPAMEGVLYHHMLILSRVTQQKYSTAGIRHAKEKAENNKYDYFLGHYQDGSEVQKFYYQHEIEYLLKKAGFSGSIIQKVQYPWGEACGDYQDFPSEDPIWDWFIHAKKL